MSRRALLALLPLVLIAGLAPAAAAQARCVYEERILVVNDSLEVMSDELSTALDNAEGKTDAGLAEEWATFGRRMRKIGRRVRALEPPERLRKAHRILRAAIPPVRDDLFAMSRAASDHDAIALQASLIALVADGQVLRRSRLSLARRAKARLREARCG